MAQGKALDPEVRQEMVKLVRTKKATPRQLAKKHRLALTTVYRMVRQDTAGDPTMRQLRLHKISKRSPRQRRSLPGGRGIVQLMAREVLRLERAVGPMRQELERAQAALQLLTQTQA